MFCVKCGKKADTDSFCAKCFLEKESLFEIRDFSISVCDSCGKIEHVSSLKDLVMQKIRPIGEVRDCSVSEKRFGNRITLTVKCRGKIAPLKKEIEQERKALVMSRKKKCENCIRLSGGYYEGIFQIRGPNQKKLFDIIRIRIPDDQLTNIIKLKEGYDIRVISKKVASRIARDLSDEYQVTTSFKFVTEKKGKKMYRSFYAIR